jgi:hypothetical protein
MVALVLLSIFFTLNQYRLIYMENRGDREALVAANTVLSSCIAEVSSGMPVKGLLSEDEIKLFEDVDNGNIHCLKYEKGIYTEIYSGDSLLYGFGDSSVCARMSNGECIRKVSTSYSTFPASMKRSDGKVIPVVMEVFVG